MRITRNRESVAIKPRTYDMAGLPTRYFNPGELETLLHLYEMVRPRVIVEFGVNAGRNPAAALRNIPSIERYIGVDVPPGYVPRMTCQRKEIPTQPGHLATHDPRFELILKPRGTFDLSPDDLPEACAVFIDADHSRVGVENDYALAKAIVRKGGVIVFHDDNCLPQVEVTQTINDICASGADIKHVHGTWLAFEVR
ncbi:MAG TPA: class I SAM-dependent methyltransferase [Methylophilaceae bacterium]